MREDAMVLLIGSVPLRDADSVFRLLSEKLGRSAPRYPDGETGERINWIRWQRRIFDDNPAFELQGLRVGFSNIKDALARPFFTLRPGVSPHDIAFNELGFAAEAARSFAIFAKLKAEGIVPRGTRFQVSLPTPLAIISGFVVLDDRAKAEPALETATAREVGQIVAGIPSAELSIQWDVCLEIVGCDGGYELHYDDILANSVRRIARQIDVIPDDVEVGVHLCYGDPGHKHLVEPKDTATSVAFANAICATVKRSVTWVHMPIPRGWLDEQYYAPLSSLNLPAGVELYLGLVHYTDGVDGTLTRARAARPFVERFGIATECGFGRRDEKTIPSLLDLLRDSASATRALTA
jgi:methionine synthase II (cobalamin-independent)